MEIRKSTPGDLDRMQEIYAHARRFMAEHGNPNQWGPTGWPPVDLLKRDIESGNSYVCVHEGRVVGTFYFVQGRDIEPTYARIDHGAWRDDSPYGVVHRIASDGSARGVGAGTAAVSGRPSSLSAAGSRPKCASAVAVRS